MAGAATGRITRKPETLDALFGARRDLIQRRFDARYERRPSGCWLWTGGFDHSRYGQFYISQYKVGAHRVSYALRHGPIPEGMIVCHHCDQPSCVNPDHLFLGTDLDNNADRSAKRRTHQPFGSGAHYRKLTADKVRLILTDSRSARALAFELGVNPNTVAKIRRGETWKHVTVPALSSAGAA